MIKSGDILDLGPLRTKFYIQKTAADTQGQSFEMEMELGTNTGGTPLHTHPKAIETFKVLQGQFDIYVQDSWNTFSTGKSVSVKEGIPHTFRNTSNEPSRVYLTLQPAMRIEEYFERLHKMVNNGVVKSENLNLKSMLHLSILMTDYPHEVHPIKPPYPVMRVFASVGRLLGYQV